MTILKENTRLKVLCTNRTSRLTLYKEYEVYYEDGDYFRVLGDAGRLVRVHKKLFGLEVPDEHVQKEQIILYHYLFSNFKQIIQTQPEILNKLSRNELRQLRNIQHKLLNK